MMPDRRPTNPRPRPWRPALRRTTFRWRRIRRLEPTAEDIPMRELSSDGEAALAGIAKRHGFSVEAARHMLDAVMRGNGSMAQFSHPEFGGSGQWMRGGMTMVSDLFNNPLKGRVDALCGDLSDLSAKQPDLTGGSSLQSQNQGGQRSQAPSNGASRQPAGTSDRAGDAAARSSASNSWWPAELHSPNSTGSQNDMRYAYFSDARRLAVDCGGKVTVYDTLDHQIGGVSQQQSGSASLTFSSQHGPIDLATLPVVTAG